MGKASGTVAGQVDGDSEEPRFEVPARIETSTSAESPHERLLKEVLCFRGVATEPAKYPEERSSIPFQKGSRGAFVAGKHEPGHLLVGGAMIKHRISMGKSRP